MSQCFDLLLGVGGIGAGILFRLEGNQTLGRNESRPAELCEARDYNKLHIITQYVAVLLGAGAAEPAPVAARPSFAVLPVGCVGQDVAGQQLLREMRASGMDTQYVRAVQGRPTLMSVCFQYPDGSGGNLTSSNSAAADLAIADLEAITPLLARHGARAMVLAAPEVPLGLRARLLELGSQHGCFRVAAFTSTELATTQGRELLKQVDLLALNEDEAAALSDGCFEGPELLMEKLTQKLARASAGLILSQGSRGAWGRQGRRNMFVPALSVPVKSTAGAGDALLGGVLAALAAGMPLIDPAVSETGWSGRRLTTALELGVLLAGLKVTSPHTIHPRANFSQLCEFAKQNGADVGEFYGQ